MPRPAVSNARFGQQYQFAPTKNVPTTTQEHSSAVSDARSACEAQARAGEHQATRSESRATQQPISTHVAARNVGPRAPASPRSHAEHDGAHMLDESPRRQDMEIDYDDDNAAADPKSATTDTPTPEQQRSASEQRSAPEQGMGGAPGGVSTTERRDAGAHASAEDARGKRSSDVDDEDRATAARGAALSGAQHAAAQGQGGKQGAAGYGVRGGVASASGRDNADDSGAPAAGGSDRGDDQARGSRRGDVLSELDAAADWNADDLEFQRPVPPQV